MSRAKLLIWILAPVALLSGCSLRQPVYNPMLGGFPMYKNTTHISHEVESREGERRNQGVEKSHASVNVDSRVIM